MSPTLFQTWLYEDPIPLAALGAVLAFAGLAVARRRNQKLWLLLTLAGVTLSVGIVLLVSAVQTPREQLIQTTRKLVDATAPIQPDTLRAFFHDDARLLGPDRERWLSLQGLFNALEKNIHRFNIEQNDIKRLEIENAQPRRGVSLFDVNTRFQGGTGYPAGTRWRITFERATPDQPWKIRTIQWLNHDGPNGITPREGIWR